MKKILILIPVLLITFGCVESELIVPGENVGEGNVDENPTDTGTILQSFNYTTPVYNYQYNFDSDGNLNQADAEINLSGTTQFGSQNFTFSNGLLVSVNSDVGTYSNTTTILYDDNGRPIELNAGTSPENKLVLTYNGNDITGVRTIDGEEENTINFTTDGAGYINGYSFTDASSGNDYELMLNLTGNQLSNSIFQVNGNTTQEIEFTYDNKINPIYAQTIDIFNQMILQQVFEFESDVIDLQLDTYALYRSANNITQYVAEGSGAAFIEGTVNMSYEYNEDNYPTNAVITVEGEDPGSIVYTYY